MQAKLAGFGRDDRLKPSSERAAPALWVRRIQVVREMRVGDQYVVRDVRLRRGLNIIWAPPVAREPKLFESGVAGHTAGKTTFCRLVRYVLGEGTFASDSTRKRIRAAFPSGWVLAEVFLEDELWIVGRPFAVGAHSFCANSSTIESLFAEAERRDYKFFRERLTEITLAQLGSMRFPTEETIRWEHLLPWLARDQECRFGDFLTWRDPASESDAPGTTSAERQFVVRALVGLLESDETLEQRRNARLLSERKHAAELEPLLLHHARLEHSRVERLLAVGVPLPPPSSDLFGSKVEQELSGRRSVVDERLARLAADGRSHDLQRGLERAIEREVRADVEARQTEERLEQERATLDQLRARTAGDAQIAILASLPPSTGYCSVPLSVARDRECPLALSTPLRFNDRLVQRTAAQELEDLSTVVHGLEHLVSQKRSEHALTVAEANHARRRLLEASTNHQQALTEAMAEAAKLTQIANLAGDARGAWQRAEVQSARVKTLDADIEASYSRQKELRKKIRRALQQFSISFDFITRALLGNEVQGEVDTAGRDLQLVMNEHGERDSAAFSTVKLLAFDLAALVSSIEGRGFHPRFLLHDGPREADLSPDVYARLFLLIRELEKQTAIEPPFQYIVTTTTAPPREFQGEPWLRLELSGTPSSERLLRRDL
jgi:hypothetical protein